MIVTLFKCPSEHSIDTETFLEFPINISRVSVGPRRAPCMRFYGLYWAHPLPVLNSLGGIKGESCSFELSQSRYWEGLRYPVIHTTKSLYTKDVVSPDRHGSFTCEMQYVIAILYDHLILTLLYRKLSYTIVGKYCTSQAKLPCPVKRSDTFSVHRFSSLILVYPRHAMSR